MRDERTQARATAVLSDRIPRVRGPSPATGSTLDVPTSQRTERAEPATQRFSSHGSGPAGVAESSNDTLAANVEDGVLAALSARHWGGSWSRLRHDT